MMKVAAIVFRIALLFLLGFSIHRPGNAQPPTSVWGNFKKTTQVSRKKVRRLYGKAKQLKSHIEKWGLDSSYNRGLGIGARLNSNGWTGLLSYQQRINKRTLVVYQLSLSEIKHEKEIKQQRQNTAYPQLGNSSPFIFGKTNNAYQLQLGYGRESLILPGVLEGNLSIGLRLQGGFCLTVLKPYVLKLIYVKYAPDEQAFILDEKYSDANAEKFLNTSYILGRGKWKEGLGEISYIPGCYIDGAVTIEAIRNKVIIKAISLGGNFAVHTENIEIMAGQKAWPWSAALYVSLQIGKRWN